MPDIVKSDSIVDSPVVSVPILMDIKIDSLVAIVTKPTDIKS